MEVACSGIEGGCFEDQECGLCVCSHSVFFLFLYLLNNFIFLKEFFRWSFAAESIHYKFLYGTDCRTWETALSLTGRHDSCCPSPLLQCCFFYFIINRNGLDVFFVMCMTIWRWGKCCLERWLLICEASICLQSESQLPRTWSLQWLEVRPFSCHAERFSHVMLSPLPSLQPSPIAQLHSKIIQNI